MKKAVYGRTHPLKRQWIIALVAALAALVAGATTDALADPPGANQMKVMSWNILASQGNFDGWVDAIATLKPAVAGLQEACPTGLEGIMAFPPLRNSSSYGQFLLEVPRFMMRTS